MQSSVAAAGAVSRLRAMGVLATWAPPDVLIVPLSGGRVLEVSAETGPWAVRLLPAPGIEGTDPLAGGLEEEIFEGSSDGQLAAFVCRVLDELTRRVVFARAADGMWAHGAAPVGDDAGAAASRTPA